MNTELTKKLEQEEEAVLQRVAQDLYNELRLDKEPPEKGSGLVNYIVEAFALVEEVDYDVLSAETLQLIRHVSAPSIPVPQEEENPAPELQEEKPAPELKTIAPPKKPRKPKPTKKPKKEKKQSLYSVIIDIMCQHPECSSEKFRQLLVDNNIDIANKKDSNTAYAARGIVKRVYAGLQASAQNTK